MKADEKLLYATARMDAYMVIEFMLYENFYDKDLEKKLQNFIEKINKQLENER